MIWHWRYTGETVSIQFSIGNYLNKCLKGAETPAEWKTANSYYKGLSGRFHKQPLLRDGLESQFEDCEEQSGFNSCMDNLFCTDGEIISVEESTTLSIYRFKKGQ